MNKKKVFLLLAVEFVILIVCFYGFFRFFNAYRELQLLSSVKAPVRMALADIAKDMDARNYNTAQKKLAELQTQWYEFEPKDDMDGSEGLGNIMVEFHAIEGQSKLNGADQ